MNQSRRRYLKKFFSIVLSVLMVFSLVQINGGMAVHADDQSVMYDFRTDVFKNAISNNSYTSTDGKVSISGGSLSYNGAQHGANVKNDVISISVPAGKTTLTIGQCCYSNATATLTAGSSTDVISTLSLNNNDSKDVTDTSVSYTSSEAVTLKLNITGNGYLHYIKVQTSAVQPTAAVSGTVGTGAAGEVLNFLDGATVEATATVGSDGTYSVDLPISSTYTVAFANADVYKIANGSSVDLTSTAAGASVTNNITYSKYDSNKSFDLTIGGTKFTVKPGESASDDFIVSADSGDGSVEVATASEALVWADLNGKGNGTLQAGDVTDVSSNVTATISGNVITAAYTDTSSEPVSYKLAVRDNSASGTPKQDGTPVSYDFTSADVLSTVSSLHAKGSSYTVKNSSIVSPDKLITFTGAANGGIYVNDATHGLAVSAGSTINVKVAGDAVIDFTDCQYSGGNVTASVTMDDASASAGTVDPATAVSLKATTDGTDTSEFKYKGDAATITFTFAGGTAYVHKMAVTNAAPEASIKLQPEMPNDTTYGTKENLTVSAAGQRLVLAQTNGKLQTVNGAVDKSVSYYTFDPTSEDYTLEADVTMNTCASGNTSGVFFGAFNDTYIATLGLRNSTNLRGIYSKKTTDMAGAGGVNASITAGTTVHFKAERTEDGFIVTATPKGCDTYTMKFPYNNSGYLLFQKNGKATPVSYGFIVSNATVTITNMLYTNAKNEVRYDQNDCYTAAGTAPKVTSVNAAAAADRQSISVNWTSSTDAEGDGRYVLQATNDNGATWKDVATDITEKTYTYEIASTESGTYQFRVCGMLGANGKRNEYQSSSPVTVIAALKSPVVTAEGGSDLISVNWKAVAQAEKYEIYRYSADETAANAKKIATVDNGVLKLETSDATEGSTVNQSSDEFTFVNRGVTAEEPYYYYAIAYSSDNYSNPSDTSWALASAGHTGKYVYEEKADGITITKKSYDTVYTDQITLEGVVENAASVVLDINGTAQPAQSVAAGKSFAFDDVKIAQGRNDVNLTVTDANGKVTRKTYNFVYLTNYNKVVDQSFTGSDGSNNADGIPTYTTVQAAVNSVSSTNTDRVVILVKEGSYEENLQVTNPLIALIGEDSTKTHIFYNTKANVGGDMTKRCAVLVGQNATGFSAENLTIENTYDYQGTSKAGLNGNESADALRNDANNAEYINVRILGYQDTLCANQGTQTYKKCTIEGNVDFIYGNEPRAYFDDCQLVFRYNANKNSGYVCAPKTSASANYGLIFNNCEVTSESSCSGSKYYLARPWGADASITWINCYLGKVLSGTSSNPYSDMSGNLASNARFYEYGSYGPGYAVNANRRQISSAMAENLKANLGWDPAGVSSSINSSYIGSVKTSGDPKYITAEYQADDTKYNAADGDDTALVQYAEEGYAQNGGTNGGGLLKETSSNYYTVNTAEDFLKALTNVKKNGQPAVVELTSNIALGSKEVANFDSYSSIIKASNNEPLLQPTLLKTGMSSLMLDGISNLTIYSKNGAKIKHVTTDITNSNNLIIRNIKFDEDWEWDEATKGDYDRNDWDYMTIEKGSQNIWIDHCTFYKAYDGVVDVKTPTNASNVTISWCSFLPGSENNTFFDEMMNKLAADPDSYPYYKSLMDAGMTKEQIYQYAYCQKKTSLMGQNDSDTSASQIYATLANNYYKDSMDRMPRMRFGTAHVYNCIMDSQDNMDARNEIAKTAGVNVADHIVSNGSTSCCGAHVLLENCNI